MRRRLTVVPLVCLFIIACGGTDGPSIPDVDDGTVVAISSLTLVVFLDTRPREVKI